MVVNALGVEIPKGKTADSLVSIQEVSFPGTVTTAGVPLTDQIGGYIELVRPIAALLIAAIVFAIFFFMLRRAKPEENSFELVDDMATDNTQNALPAGEAENENEAEEVDMSFLPSKSLKVSPELLNNLIRQKPENVGATLRDWLIKKTDS